MKVSVVVITRDTREMTLACLGSIRAGFDGAPVEVVVVDNGSSDGTLEAVSRAYPDTLAIRNEANQGYARAANRGWRRSSGDAVLFLNSDAVLVPGAGSILVRFLEGNPQAGLAGPQLLHEDGSLQHSIDSVPTLATELLNKSLLRRLFPATYLDKRRTYGKPTPVPTLVGACLAARRECLAALDGFDERFFFFLEETDLCVRAGQAGWEVHLVPEARVTHLQGRTARRRRASSRIEYFRSRYAFFRKHRGAPVTALLAAGLVVRLALECVFQGSGCAATLFSNRSLRERWTTTVALLGWHLMGCPAEGGLGNGREAGDSRQETETGETETMAKKAQGGA